MDLSIVIPVFNESAKIGKDIRSAVAFLNDSRLEGEIIVVDDGSVDDTAKSARDAEADIPNDTPLEVIQTEHRGKGHAIRTGMMATRGDYVMFADSGGCVPFEDTLRGIKLIRDKECDIAHGSRKMKGCHIIRRQNMYRRLCSRLFHWLVIKDMGVPAELTDTQCGFKIYRGDVGRHLYGECIIDGYAIDIEVVLRALQEGYKIKEFAIDWSCDPDSRLLPVRNSWQIFRELLRIRRKVVKNG
ncbi:MAG: glycosyltransferase [Phycisphaerales bacterium]|nr:MAG: glycosyltransferase [Phycisphaerales bacterium]